MGGIFVDTLKIRKMTMEETTTTSTIATTENPTTTNYNTSMTANILRYEEIYTRYKNAGQEHVLDYYETIPSDIEKQMFLQQLNDIPVEQLPSLFEMATSHLQRIFSCGYCCYGHLGNASDNQLSQFSTT